MDLHEYVEHDATALSERLARGEVSAAELEACAREAIERLNPALNAITEVFDEPDADPGATGPLRGVPFLIKDIALHAAGRKYEMGSRLAQGLVTPHDSHLMERFRAAGLVTLGRTNLPEFGWNITTEPVLRGPTHNPWALDRMPGGSSGGSAAAVAAGIVPLAHANDGAGSIRIPAACCGLVGLKPTRGRIPPGPDVGDPIFGFGCEFAVSRSVRDSALLLDAVHGAGPGDPYVIAPPAGPYREAIARPPRRLRIACTAVPWSGVPVDAEVRAALTATAKLCADLGHAVEEASPPLDDAMWYEAGPRRLYPASVAYWVEEVARLMGRTPGPDNLEACVVRTWEYGRQLSAADILQGLSLTNTICRTVAPFFQQYDLLLTPTNARVPQPLGTYNANDAGLDFESFNRHFFSFSPFTSLFNMTGQPALTLPLARTATDLPIGMQFAGRWGDEATLLAIAAQLEQAAPWPQIAPLSGRR